MSRGENRVKNYLTNSRFDLDAAFGIKPGEKPIWHKADGEEEPIADTREDILKRFISQEKPNENAREEKYETSLSDNLKKDNDIVTLAQTVLELAKSLESKEDCS